MADRRFSDDTATADSIVNVGNSDDSNSDSDSDSDDDDDEEDFDLAGGPPPGEVQGTGSGGGSSSSGGSSRGAAAAAKAIATMKKSLERNRTKHYAKWPRTLLKEACSMRKVVGFSRCSDADQMAKVLTDLDSVMKRSSPFLQDLDDKVAGGTPASQPPASAKEAETIPETLIMATKAAMDMGASFEPGKLLPSGKKSYTAAAVLAVIQGRAQAEGGDQSTASRRKSRHCVPRLCEVIARPENRARWAEHRTQLTKQELDAKVTGRTRQVLLDVWNQFKDEGLQVPSTFADDDRVMAAGIDPNVVHQPDISYDKFMTMKNDLVKDHGDMYGNFKKSGSMGEMYEFCKGSLDTYYYGLMVTQYPEIEQATTQMLPDGTERENTGVGGAAGGEGGPDAAAADARRRTEAKAGAKERSVDLSKEKKKKQKQEKDIEHVTRVAMTAAKDTLGLGAGIGSLLDMSSGPSGLKFDDAPTSFFDTIEGCDTKAKKLELSSLLRKELQDIKASIRKEKALGSEADPEDLELMELEANRVRVALRKQLAEAL